MERHEPDLFELQRRAALGTVCAGIAHEVQGPLDRAVELLGRALQRARGVPAAVEDDALVADLGRALESIDLAAGVLRDALHLALPSEIEGKTELSRDVDAVVGLSAMARPRNVAVNLELEPGLSVRGTRTHVQQIALNLLMNAFRALDERSDGRVRVATRSTGRGSAQLLVEDNGPGIPAELRLRLFQPFAASRISGEGTGLGLHVVKRITEMLGGSIELRSEPGRGTSVCVELPWAG